MYHSKYSTFLLCLFAFVLAGCGSGPQSRETPTGSSPSENNGNTVENTNLPQYSYMMTNRTHPNTQDTNDVFKVVPLAKGELLYYTGNAPFAVDSADYQYESASDFTSKLQNDLNQVASDGVAQVTLFIHGLSTTWNGALAALGGYADSLNSHGYTNGVTVGFSWPSFGSVISELLYSFSYPVTDSAGTIRNNINGSVVSFKNAIGQLLTLDTANSYYETLRINVAAHSEGNFMLMLGMNYINSLPDPLNGRKIDQVLMMAADVNDAALQKPTHTISASGATGDGGAIAHLAKYVTVYYSSEDATLLEISAFCPVHNPQHLNRLGYVGAYDYASLQPNVSFVSCKMANNPDRLDELIDAGYLDPATSTHTSYLHVADLLADEAQTLMLDQSSGSLGKRTAAIGTDPSLYCLEVDSFQTEGTICIDGISISSTDHLCDFSTD